MKNTLLLILLFFTINLSFSQSYGNEWINYSQKYYKFPIVSSGMYKIPYETLYNAGVPLNIISHQNFQLFGKGKPEPIYIDLGGDNSFDPGDYVLFYGERNSAWLDSTLYNNQEVSHPSYSLFNDTLYYYFTWNNSNNNLRYQEFIDFNFDNFTYTDYWLQKVILHYNSSYVEMKDNYSDNVSSQYRGGKGWGSGNMNGLNSNSAITLNYANRYLGNDAPQTYFNLKLAGVSNAQYSGTGNHHFKLTIQPSNTEIHNQIFSGYTFVNVNTYFPSSLLQNGNTNIMFQGINDQGALTSSIRLLYAEAIFPRSTTVAGLNKTDFLVKNHPTQGRTKFRITNTNAFTNPIMLVKGSTHRLVRLQQNAPNTYDFMIPNTLNDSIQKVYLQNLNVIPDISTISPVSSTGYFTNYHNFNYDNSLIMIYHPTLELGTNDYYNYRVSPQGGSNNVVKVNIEDLYHQYSGGVVKHPLAIRRFLEKVYVETSVKPKALFLLGKGLNESVYRKTPALFPQNLIPTYGNPGSDIFFTANISNYNWEPKIPTGRISVSTNVELLDYLKKIKEFEQEQIQSSIYSTPEKDWQKQVLHFGGGTDAYQQNIMSTYLSIMENTIENKHFGGNVKTYLKTSSAPLDPNMLIDLNVRLKKGVSLMNFFGHASGTGFEINIDEPSNWDNNGKYPFMIGNACYTGDLFLNDVSISEKFVRIADKGAIGFLSAAKVGYISPLYQYSNELYKQIATTNYGNTISQQIKQTVASLQGTSSVFIEAVCSQMTLHADPLLKINWHTKPEIEINQSSVFFKPDNITLDTDSLELNLVLTNLGKSVLDTFYVEIIRKFPNSSIDSTYLIPIAKLHYKDTVKLKMPLQSNIAIGLNTFDINVDIPSQIEEQYDEINNNRITSNLFIDIDGIMPVYPYNYAVVPKDTITLKASTINPLASINTYRFEIDTTDLFNSPFRKYALKTELGGVKEINYNEWKNVSNNQTSPLICTDSTVYFWRVAIDSSVHNWKEHSFQYIKGKKGWGQDHFYQFKNGSFTNIDYDRQNRLRHFDTLTKRIKVVAYSNAIAASSFSQTAYFINDIEQDYQVCTGTPSIHVAVIDPITFQPWKSKYTTSAGVILNPNHDFGNANNNGACRQREEAYFIFRQNSQQQLQNWVNMIENSVPNGHYIVMYTSHQSLFSNWTTLHPDVYQMFNNLGSTMFDTLQNSTDNRGFVFLCKKGDPNSIIQQLGSIGTVNERLEVEKDIYGLDYNGIEVSTLIGPASKWETIYWKQNPQEVPSQDRTTLTVKLFNQNQNLITQFDTTMTLLDSIVNFNNLYDATTHPYMQLQARYTDSTSSTPAQINRWHILYQPLPEAAIDGTNGYYLSHNISTISEGEKFKFAIDVKNISDYHMDSLLINYWIEDQHQVKHPISYPRQDSLRVANTIRDTVEINTLGFSGTNVLWMEVNPYIDQTNTIKDQLEQYHFNNILQIPFKVNPDTINPILDVTFDGRRIMNGDIISPIAELVISLKDENPLLIMNEDSDTTKFGVYLTYPNGEQKRIPFINTNGQSIMQWIPAESTNKKFKIIYPANFEQDGKYTLFVQGSDKSGNLSGNIEYKVSFEVIHESSITYLMNYPNPFSTSTKFVFTVTGSQVPEDILIQIMTVTGKVVREITEDELGPLFIGRNITTYAWDGTDEFGDRLANGVYLYRVLSRINGEEIKHKDSGADKYFKKEFGKMYLMR